MKYVSYSQYFTWKHWTVVYAIVTIFSFAPLLSVILSSVLSRLLGCDTANEGSAAGCRGEGILSVLFALGWLGLITFPFGGFLMILLIVANILWYFSHKSGETQSF